MVRVRIHGATLACMLGVATIVTGCAAPTALRAFTTDGCSMFPDRALIGKADWCSCCLAHDLAYWQGGTAEERLAAHRELARCVKDAAHSRVLATTMLAGVRAGGSAYLPASYRWGYGWQYGRGYQPLSDSDKTQAASLRAAYLERNPELVCTAPGSAQPAAE